MNLGDQSSRGRGLESRVRGWASSFGVRLVMVAVAASAAIGQPEEPVPSPLDDTWDYLVELFRMLVGL